MNDENIHIGALLKQFLAYWKIYTPIGIICLIAAVCFLIATPQEYQFTARSSSHAGSTMPNWKTP
mgnify:CR=1 FL=1